MTNRVISFLPKEPSMSRPSNSTMQRKPSDQADNNPSRGKIVIHSWTWIAYPWLATHLLLLRSRPFFSKSCWRVQSRWPLWRPETSWQYCPLESSVGNESTRCSRLARTIRGTRPWSSYWACEPQRKSTTFWSIVMVWSGAYYYRVMLLFTSRGVSPAPAPSRHGTVAMKIPPPMDNTIRARRLLKEYREIQKIQNASSSPNFTVRELFNADAW